MVERYPKTYIITTAQVGGDPFKKFIAGLQKRRKENHGEIIILPTNGALAGKAAKTEELDPYLRDKNNFRVVEGTLPLNANIYIMRDIIVKAEAPNPYTNQKP